MILIAIAIYKFYWKYPEFPGIVFQRPGNEYHFQVVFDSVNL